MTLSLRRGVTWSLYTALGLLSGLGCTVQTAGPEDGVVSTEEAPLVPGNWSLNQANGSIGSNPWRDTSLVAQFPCEAWNSSDRRWHPGKLWANSCRIAWGDGVLYYSGYRTLTLPTAGPTYTWQPYTGPVPTNAVVSDEAQSVDDFIPVCKYNGGGGIEATLGKLWQKNCEFEWGGHKVVRGISSGISVLVQ